MERQTQKMFLDGFDYVFERLTSRIATLTDEEYLWEPVPGCMTIHATEDGVAFDGRLRQGEGESGPPPFTTVAWRLCHIGGEVLFGFAKAIRDGRPRQFEPDSGWPADAEAVRGFLKEGYAQWREVLNSMSEERLAQPLGAAWGPFGEDSHAALILHIFDELVHHSAEVGTLRDLYAHGYKATDHGSRI